jgi:hypothetical protein
MDKEFEAKELEFKPDLNVDLNDSPIKKERYNKLEGVNDYWKFEELANKFDDLHEFLD